MKTTTKAKLTITCKTCEVQMSVPAKYRGKTIKCLKCGRPVFIPRGETKPMDWKAISKDLMDSVAAATI